MLNAITIEHFILRLPYHYKYVSRVIFTIFTKIFLILPLQSQISFDIFWVLLVFRHSQTDLKRMRWLHEACLGWSYLNPWLLLHSPAEAGHLLL